jgi:hypothetical protein
VLVAVVVLFPMGVMAALLLSTQLALSVAVAVLAAAATL